MMTTWCKVEVKNITTWLEQLTYLLFRSRHGKIFYHHFVYLWYRPWQQLCFMSVLFTLLFIFVIIVIAVVKLFILFVTVSLTFIFNIIIVMLSCWLLIFVRFKHIILCVGIMCVVLFTCSLYCNDCIFIKLHSIDLQSLIHILLRAKTDNSLIFADLHVFNITNTDKKVTNIVFIGRDRQASDNYLESHVWCYSTLVSLQLNYLYDQIIIHLFFSDIFLYLSLLPLCLFL